MSLETEPVSSYLNGNGERVQFTLCGCIYIDGNLYKRCQSHKPQRTRKSNGQIRF